MTGRNVKVCVRIRPLTTQERGEAEREGIFSQEARTTVVVLDERSLVFDPTDVNRQFIKGVPTHDNKRTKDITYSFDRVFGQECTQVDIYENAIKDLVDGVLNGINSTVFAYGATGAGKTHTISGSSDNPGIMPLAMKDLFERLNSMRDEFVADLTVSYMEVYNECIRDLLTTQRSTAALDLRETEKGGVVVAGLSEHQPSSFEDVSLLLELGTENRTMSATKANETSSRSHAVFQINVLLRPKNEGLSSTVQAATLTLCDLAGSERAAATDNKGEQLREGANINKSLLALGNCINALCKNDGKKAHVPFRDSKLTRLLKTSLTGNCRTVMIANVSPFHLHLEETHNTLKYAWRTKQIKLDVSQNLIQVKYNVSQYVEKIGELQNRVKELEAEVERMKLDSSPTGDVQKIVLGYLKAAGCEVDEIQPKSDVSLLLLDHLKSLHKLSAEIDNCRARRLIEELANSLCSPKEPPSQVPHVRPTTRRKTLLPTLSGMPPLSIDKRARSTSRRQSLLPVPASIKRPKRSLEASIESGLNEIEQFLQKSPPAIKVQDENSSLDNCETPKPKKKKRQPIVFTGKQLRELVNNEVPGSPFARACPASPIVKRNLRSNK